MSGRPELVAAAFHLIEYLGLLGGVGSFVIRRLGRMPPRIRWARPPMVFAFGLALVGGIGLFALSPTLPVAARVLAEIAALFLCLRGHPYVAPFALIATLLLALSGHAAGVFPAGGAEFADALHVLSAGIWAGGILALASLRPPGGWRSPEARSLLERFARVALIAFGITALTGVLRATEQLNSVSDLWMTAYGLVLTLKSAGVLVMLVLSALAWWRRIATARLEAAIAVVVVAATAVLASFPMPAIVGIR
jgi:putative copper export protein